MNPYIQKIFYTVRNKWTISLGTFTLYGLLSLFVFALLGTFVPFFMVIVFILLVGIVIGFWCYIGYFILKWTIFFLSKTLARIFFSRKKFEILLDDFIYEQGDMSQVDDILRKSIEISTQLRKVGRWNGLMKMTHSDNEYYEYVLRYSESILLDLKGDLEQNMKKYQASLYSAKRDLETQIAPYKNLENVAETQVYRIDKQIEQFEVLQKILIRV